jgi:hypothetical protein
MVHPTTSLAQMYAHAGPQHHSSKHAASDGGGNTSQTPLLKADAEAYGTACLSICIGETEGERKAPAWDDASTWSEKKKQAEAAGAWGTAAAGHASSTCINSSSRGLQASGFVRWCIMLLPLLLLLPSRAFPPLHTVSVSQPASSSPQSSLLTLERDGYDGIRSLHQSNLSVPDDLPALQVGGMHAHSAAQHQCAQRLRAKDAHADPWTRLCKADQHAQLSARSPY